MLLNYKNNHTQPIKNNQSEFPKLNLKGDINIVAVFLDEFLMLWEKFAQLISSTHLKVAQLPAWINHLSYKGILVLVVQSACFPGACRTQHLRFLSQVDARSQHVLRDSAVRLDKGVDLRATSAPHVHYFGHVFTELSTGRLGIEEKVDAGSAASDPLCCMVPVC